MLLRIPKISVNSLNKNQLAVYKQLNNEAFDQELAQRVTKKLLKNPGEFHGLYHSPRDYCGMGFFLANHQFFMGAVYDGMNPYPVVATFNGEHDFMKWLAGESDQSMSLYGKEFNNQTITKIRLLWYLEENYNSGWNAYCKFLRQYSV